MAKEKLGTKRICPSCSVKFYDLKKSPAICPHCEHSFEPEEEARRKAAKGRAKPKAAEAEAAKEKEAETKDSALPAEEGVVSFEEADQEAAGAKGRGVSGLDSDDADTDGIDDIEIDDDGEEDNSLLDNETDDFSDDVSGIIDKDIKGEV